MKKTLNSAGVPAWMVTFADLMALMMTFFVLLYSFSNTDEGKYEAVVDSMARGFGAQWIEWPRENLGQTGPEPGVFQIPILSDPTLTKSADSSDKDTSAESNHQAEFERFSSELADDIKAGTLMIERLGNQISVRFPAKTLFMAGSDAVDPEILPMLDRVAHILSSTKGMIVVSGHTDNRPIHTERFRSNWELSTSRAVSVVHVLLEHYNRHRPRVTKVMGQITAVGHAGQRPLVLNDSKENRAKNRRVEISITLPENDDPS